MQDKLPTSPSAVPVSPTHLTPPLPPSPQTTRPSGPTLRLLPAAARGGYPESRPNFRMDAGIQNMLVIHTPRLRQMRSSECALGSGSPTTPQQDVSMSSCNPKVSVVYKPHEPTLRQMPGKILKGRGMLGLHPARLQRSTATPLYSIDRPLLR